MTHTIVQPYEANIKSIPGLVADGTLATSQYLAMKISGILKVAVNDSKGGFAVGILQDEPGDTEAATVAYTGQSKMIAGTGGVAAGDLIASDTDGTGITASAEEYFLGAALTTADAGEIFIIDLDAKGYVKAA
ncbi:MAG: hypothetical protein PHE55_08835 [Methylococcaceae bacterium]|nr:hypothetical protein [Methylococcaceae bacterium]